MRLDFNRPQEFRVACGTFEEKLVRKVRTELEDRKVHIADIGANIGYHSLLFNSTIDAGKIDAYEPYPPALSRLYENLELNESTDICVYECALCSSNSEVKLTRPEGGNLAQATILNQSGERKAFNVEARTLDECYLNSEYPDLLKVDIEGAELELLRGGERTVQKADTLILETHGGRLSDDAVEEIRKRLVDAGFSKATLLVTGKEYTLSSGEMNKILSSNTQFWIE